MPQSFSSTGISAQAAGGGEVMRWRLANPYREIGLTEALSCWHHVHIRALCVRAADLARDPRMAARMRGALGRQLLLAASVEAREGRPCPWSPPCLLDVLFGQHGKTAGGLEIPKPYIATVRPQGEDLLAEITLFGFAGDLAEAVAEALVRGLREGLNEGETERACYRPLQVAGREIVVADGLSSLSPQADGGILQVVLESPLAIRSGDAVKEPSFGDLVSSLGNRLQGLARWQDATLTADWPKLIAEARNLPCHTVVAAPQHWRRGSTRQNRGFDVGGGCGQWLTEMPSVPLRQVLTLGQSSGAGGRTTLGLGRFRLDLAGKTPQTPWNIHQQTDIND